MENVVPEKYSKNSNKDILTKIVENSMVVDAMNTTHIIKLSIRAITLVEKYSDTIFWFLLIDSLFVSVLKSFIDKTD